MAACCRILASLTLVTAIFAADMEISRPVRSWEFLDALGPKAGILGREDGVLEAYVYPLKVFKDLHLVFRIDGRVIPGEPIARRIVSRPGSYTLVYSGDEYEVRETLAASSDQPGAVIRLQIHSFAPLRVDVEFTRDFQLMWPASIGTAYGEWNDKEKVWQFGADGQTFAAVLGSPDGALVDHEYLTNYSTDASDRFTLGTIKGSADRYLILAGSVRSRDEALATYRTLLANPAQQIAAAEKRYQDYLGRTVKVQLPDEQLQRAYDWAKLSEAETDWSRATVLRKASTALDSRGSSAEIPFGPRSRSPPRAISIWREPVSTSLLSISVRTAKSRMKFHRAQAWFPGSRASRMHTHPATQPRCT
jgi:hypothetical protein